MVDRALLGAGHRQLADPRALVAVLLCPMIGLAIQLLQGPGGGFGLLQPDCLLGEYRAASGLDRLRDESESGNRGDRRTCN